MQLFYHSDIPAQGTFTLDPPETKHLLKVMRKRVGDEICITNGKGFIFQCRIMNDHPSECTMEVLLCKPGKDVRNASLHLAISPVKNPSRFEWLLEKATESGLGEITPMLCHRTEKQHIKPERFQSLLISAMKQCGRTLLPKLHPPTPFSEALRLKRDNPGFIAWCGEEDLPYLRKVIPAGTDVLVMIGPEGDFTRDEIDLAISYHFLPVSLGNAILRTETAGLMASMAFNFVNS